jgi:lipid A disaccharide synthetase
LTTHERLTQLERAQRENNEQFTVLMTVVGSQGQDIKRMLNVLEQHTDILEHHTAALDSHTESLKVIESALTALIGEVREIRAIVQKGQE